MDGVTNFLSEFGDVQQYCRTLLQCVSDTTRCSNGLPAAGDDHDFYSTIDGFQAFTQHHTGKILKMLTLLSKHEGLPFSRWSAKDIEVDELTDWLVEVNDQMIDRLSCCLDELSGVAPTREPVIKQSTSHTKTHTASWNRDSREKRHIRVMHARNITRPQLKFKDTIDNSNTPFIHRLTHRPNSVARDQEEGKDAFIDQFVRQAREAGGGESTRIYESTIHPYEHEIRAFRPSERELQPVEITAYSSMEETRLTVVNTLDQLSDLNSILLKEREIAVDLEHHAYRTFQGITCLMQISTRSADYLIDVLELRSHINLLLNVFTNPAIVKVFHGADHDVLWLQRDFSLYIVNLFDTHQAACSLQLARHSLAFLLHHYCNVDADKQFQLADWRIRPLPEDMIEYARADTHYLLYVYDKMKNELIEKSLTVGSNLLMAVIGNSKQVALQVYEKPLLNDTSHLKLYYKLRRPLNDQQQKVFQSLYAWRDRVARDEDESPSYVLPNHMLLHISEVSPREVQGVLACCAPIPPLVRQHVQEIHRLIQQSRHTTGAAKTTEDRQGVDATDGSNEGGDSGGRKNVLNDEQPVRWMSHGLISSGPAIQLALPIHTVFEETDIIVSASKRLALEIEASFVSPLKPM
ncbi:exosome complex component 10-like isoform X2 [Corticium candelabrum]|uniref:exosome complex component 10-like isoform X2 n=1 Tax=Corticium candelabrum TaxID=121492 RepID=UPI002E265151|nr:exosome complex component 10-like isoform X2 [Corticium candelabrum]